MTLSDWREGQLQVLAQTFGRAGPSRCHTGEGGMCWDLLGLSVSSAWWAGCSSDDGAIGSGNPLGPEPGTERAPGAAGLGFLEESLE